MTVGDTPEYHWDTGYDGIQGFSSRLRNRVSETSTLQGGQSPRGGPRTPPEPQRQFKQLKIYDETPAGRPLPTLQQIRQANLQKIFEEEGVDTPCDICGSPHHDYRNCTKEAYRESQDVRQSPAKGRGFRGQCPNCNIPHPGLCPCAWCDQPGHIAQDCMAHFADDSMRARFPKKEKMKRTPIKHYECRRCGGSHPFNIYCPNVRDPPVIPGECRSCGTNTREHANDCQYVAIKDNIGLCTYCQAQDHRYADCPQWALDQEAVVRETRKNKKNKKRGKVKIVAGIMTREQESDSTLSPEKEEGGVGTQSPRKVDGRREYQCPLHGGYLPQSVTTPEGVIPMIIEIVQQCINISESKLMHWLKGGWENTSSHESGRDTKSQGKCHSTRDHTLEEGGWMQGNQRLVRGPLGKKHKNRKYPLSQGKSD